jgi:hypothetical protein
VRTMNAQPSRTNLLGTETHQRRWLALVHAESDALAVEMSSHGRSLSS